MARDLDSLGSARRSEAHLLALVQQGDQQALARLFENYSKLVYSVALRILHDPAAAEDVLQEIFMQIWSSPTNFDASRGDLGSWLAVVSRNRSISFLRGKRPATPVEDVSLISPYDPATDGDRNILLGRVRLLIADLPFEQRNVLDLAFFEGLTHAEIADRTGDPLGTVKTRIRLALRALRRTFATMSADPEPAVARTSSPRLLAKSAKTHRISAVLVSSQRPTRAAY
jgi:RNA polymerase sigma-70 factor, ECF subfamily